MATFPTHTSRRTKRRACGYTDSCRSALVCPVRRYENTASLKELVPELRKSLYGLKQARRIWTQLLHTKLSAVGFRRFESDMCL
uniref:Reverse transcriptase Ty1/copia-type domain-containing protein n=1 Tax=Peronospora matthiolae TaxID=2874970 RepID=A0AAV1TW18_9STRA